MNQRELAYQILKDTFKEGGYANIQMKKELNNLPTIQRAFVTELVLGVLRNFEYLKYQFKDYIKENTRLDLCILLAMAMYERFYLKEKDYVVNNEYVNLAQKEKSFINAVLHKAMTFKSLTLNSDEALATYYSLPLWMIKMLKKQYSEEEFDALMDDLKKIPKVYYRLNKKRATYDDLKDLEIEIINEDSFTSKHNLIHTHAFHKGLFYVQDVNSAKIVHFLDLEKHHRFLDACSAPGAKLYNALDIVEDAYCNDLHKHRVELIEKGAKRLGFDQIHYLNEDALNLKNVLDIQFDRILLDVPCSGLGVLKRKPDLRYHIKPTDLDDLQKLQRELLNSVSTLLKEDGIMVYSTCTINKKENRMQIDQFLKEHPNFCLMEDQNIFNTLNGDHFYVAKLKKVKDL